MSLDGAFAYPFTYWVGMETDPRTTPEALAEFNRFYSTTHVGEVVAAHPGFVRGTRYELLDQDPRSGVHAGPRWLAVYDMADAAAALQYVKDNARPWLHRRQYSPWPAARKRAKTVWRMLWRQISATESTEQASESIVVVGMNVPANTGADGLAELHVEYEQTHLPQAMAAGGYARATYLELYREFAHPAPGCPRFCAIYEAHPAATRAQDTQLTAGGPLRPGPAAGEQRDTVWRLVYRRMPPPE